MFDLQPPAQLGNTWHTGLAMQNTSHSSLKTGAQTDFKMGKYLKNRAGKITTWRSTRHKILALLVCDWGGDGTGAHSQHLLQLSMCWSQAPLLPHRSTQPPLLRGFMCRPETRWLFYHSTVQLSTTDKELFHHKVKTEVVKQKLLKDRSRSSYVCMKPLCDHNGT